MVYYVFFEEFMLIAIVILYALLALTFPLGQQAMQYVHPVVLIAARMLVAGSGFLLFHLFFARQKKKMVRADRWLFAKATFFHIYLAYIPEFWALQFLSPLKVNIIYCATPFVTALLEFFLLYKKFTLRQVAGMILGSVGVLYLAIATAPQHPCSLLSCSYPYLPELMLFVAIFSAAYAWFLVSRLNKKGYSITYINGITMFAGGILSLLTIPLVTTRPLITDFWQFTYYTALLIIIANVIAYQLYGSLLKHYRPTFLSLAGFLSPIFGAAYAYGIFGEQLTWPYFFSFTLILIALYLFYRKN
jgi:drug/metabolite transporter (DMT)-like permease